MQKTVLTISDFQDYEIKTLYACDKNREMWIITNPVTASITYKVNNRRSDWGNYEGYDLKEAITAYNEI